MRLSINWCKDVRAKKLGALSIKKAKIKTKNQTKHICLECKEENCNGICEKFKK